MIIKPYINTPKFSKLKVGDKVTYKQSELGNESPEELTVLEIDKDRKQIRYAWLWHSIVYFNIIDL